MKVNKSVEQAIYVLVILALQKDHAPIKSRVLSQILQVSDSYLKKILMVMKKKWFDYFQCQQAWRLSAGTLNRRHQYQGRF